MKIELQNNHSDIKVSESLNHYSGKVVFPEKLAKANEMLAKGGLPKEIEEERHNSKNKAV